MDLKQLESYDPDLQTPNIDAIPLSVFKSEGLQRYNKTLVQPNQHIQSNSKVLHEVATTSTASAEYLNKDTEAKQQNAASTSSKCAEQQNAAST